MKSREEIHTWSIRWMIQRKHPEGHYDNDLKSFPPILETLPPPQRIDQIDKWTIWWIQYIFRGEDKTVLMNYVRKHFTIKYESYADILSLGTRKTYFTKPAEIRSTVPEESETYDFFQRRKKTTKKESEDGILSHGFSHLRGSYPVDYLRAFPDEERRKEWLEKYGIKKRPKESMFWKS